MDRAYWTVKLIFIFVELFGIIAVTSLLYFALVHLRDLKDEIKKLENTIRERRKQ